MTSTQAPTGEIADRLGPATAAPRPTVDIVVPVYNEEQDLGPSVRRLHAFLVESAAFPFSWRITVADNASTDRTWEIAGELVAELPGVGAVRLDAKGRGRALNAVWTTSDADVLAYMDVDLSTDLAALLPLIAPLVSGHSDVAIGSRLARGARVVRGPKREFISRCYNLILRGTLRARFSDAQCGFKAIRKDVAERLLPLVEDPGWFFDTKLLVLAERSGLRIHEVPVDWVDDPDSRVDVIATAIADLRGVARLTRTLASATMRARLPTTLRSALADEHPGVPKGMSAQLLRFAAIGVVSTVAYLILYALLRPMMGAFSANALALLTCAVGNTAANRLFTFGVRGPEGRIRAQFEGLVVFALGLGLTSGSLWLLENLAMGGGTAIELVVLCLANAAATLLRFVLYRNWVFRPGRGKDIAR
ncbi:bifunctional glycosyltransferase family 2/GtrA family protein [Allokutzneria albata]|uniref:dolichyl-phosphate beta-glucosyltransferase n=1 Tax=Allokutzneria albata TaxID=211114 RepID=A0A1G9SXZ8_ALLAB|nr:bifunctional glycosyltransferase family 2/GtrA family protein [Allokutzneria albata]SDM40313.1 GtrA-like protein [Allokutzneria albata]